MQLQWIVRLLQYMSRAPRFQQLGKTNLTRSKGSVPCFVSCDGALLFADAMHGNHLDVHLF